MAVTASKFFVNVLQAIPNSVWWSFFLGLLCFYLVKKKKLITHPNPPIY